MTPLGRRARNLTILGTLGGLAGLAALGLWWILHQAASDMGADLGPGDGYRGLEAPDSQSDSRAGGGIRLRGER